MSTITCTILISPRSERIVLIPRALSRTLQLGNAKTVTIQFGSKTVSVPLRLIPTGGNTVFISSSVADSIRFPGRTVCFVRASGRELHLGPLIGVLTSVYPNSSLPFGSRTSFVREFAQSSARKSVLCVFAPHNVNWTDETVNAYVLMGGRWVRRSLPLPNVVYNRLPSRSAEKSSSMQSFKERFIRRRIPLFNWSFFDKSDVYKLLDGEVEANKHVPETQYAPTTASIQRMLERHKFVYLKPTAGSLGIGIYRLTYSPGRGYFARFRRGGTNMLIRFVRFERLVQLLQKHGVRLQQYVVQQGIRLIEQDQCPIDFRFHMTKNGHNDWVVAAIGAKKAGKGSVTTHVRSGGSLMTPEQVLRRVFGSRADDVLRRSKDVAIRLSNAIERNYPHPLAELGFDIGIDLNEQIWMFEANAKPGRSIFKLPALKAGGRASLSNLVDHCLYLSRFRARRDD
jgi:hypothetical protein